ncbi:MAG: WD40 repeat-containing [Planctomycetota bacterium]|nr:MAG: WD40 repeat-containing [Planctomycetota bacterium]
MKERLHPVLEEAVARGALSSQRAEELQREAASSGRDVATLLAERWLEATRAVWPPAPPTTDSTLATTPNPVGALDKTILAKPGDGRVHDSSLRASLLDRPSGSRSAPARFFGRYELLDEIARGGMGVVFRARQTDAQREVALKVLLAGDFASEDDERRFIREAELAAQLSHPNIVAVHDIGREDGRRNYTMELVEGKPLDKWAKGLPLEQRLRAMVKVCRAAHHAHMSGIIHRDLKPGNVLVTAQDEPKILDFGLAKASRAGISTLKTVTGQTLGTPFYMAPEQATGRVHDVDIRTDVWALGVLLHEIVDGQRPFAGTELLEVLARIEHDEPRPVEGPLELRLIVGKALEKDRARRYSTAEALAEDIERFLAGDPVSVRPPGVGRRLRRWAKKNPAATGAVLATAAAFTAGLSWEFTRPGTLVFDLSPAAAIVEIDGRPASGEVRVASGRHAVAARSPGFEPIETDVFVERGDRRTIPLHLTRSTGFLDLDADEPGTTVEIAGEIHGLPLRRHPFPTGDCPLTFRRRGCETRSRSIRVDRNVESSAWVCLPSARYAPQRVGNVFRGPITLRDPDGDGVADVAGIFSQYLLTVDGFTGEMLRFTWMYKEAGFVAWASLDWDGDGVEDDATLARYGPEVRVTIWSGREMGDPRTWRGKLSQKLLWTWSFQTDSEVPMWPRPVGIGGDLWIPVPGGIRRARAGDAEPAPPIPLPGSPSPQLAALGNDAFLALSGDILLCIERDGRERWLFKAPPGLRFPGDELGNTPLPADLPIPCTAGTDLFALDPRDGRIVWKHAGVPTEEFWLAESPHGRALTVYSFIPGGLCAWDVVTGRRLFHNPVARPEGGNFFSAWASSSWCAPEGKRLVCRSTATALPLWEFDAGAGIATDSAAADGPAGPEFGFATKDHRFIAIGEDGLLRREILLDFTPQQVHAVSLDSDGRPDWVLVGYGVQVVRSTRVLWRRRSDNAVRSRPVTFRRSGEPAIAQVMRSGDDRTEMRCLRGATGEILWRYGTEFDVMHPPAVGDWDGDGTADVWTQTGNSRQKFVCLSGMDGKELASCPIESTPYPTAVLRDLGGDARPEAILFHYPLTLCARRLGEEKPLWSVEIPQSVFQPPLLTDLDSDGRPEIVATFAAVEDLDAGIGAWTLEGRPLWIARPGDRTWGSPFAHDFDGDGKPEIALPCYNAIVFLGRDGSILARRPGVGGSSISGIHLPDGGFVIGTRAGVARLKRDGSTLWTWPGAFVSGALGVVDLPGSPAASVVGVDASGRVFRLDLDTGAERWRFELGARCEFGVTLEDLDGDGTPEALLGCDDFSLYALDLK